MKFSKHTFKKHSNVRIAFSIFALLIIFLFGVILPRSAVAYTEGKYINYFYVKCIENALSVIKSTSSDQQRDDKENSAKFQALSFLGIDIGSPISIITKEIAYLNNNEINANALLENQSDKVNNLKTFILNPFNLGEKQIKTEDAATKSNLVATLYNPALKQTLNNDRPEVLIYHSHTCEAYRTSDSDSFNTDSSIDVTRNVTAVGDIIEEELEKNYGIAVIHDKTVNDKGDYNSAYKKSGVTLDKYLKEYGDFKLIIDLHRDDVKKQVVTTKINEENLARFMFVVTEKNPKYAKQKKTIDSMIAISNKLFPTLIRSQTITTYQNGMGFYNQNKSDNAVLIEVGSNNNTIQEAKNTGKYLARIIAEQLYGKNE